MWGDHTKGKIKYAKTFHGSCDQKRPLQNSITARFTGKTGAGRPLLCGGGLSVPHGRAFALRSRRRQSSYRTSISVSSADPWKTLLMENDAPGDVRPGNCCRANSKEH